MGELDIKVIDEPTLMKMVERYTVMDEEGKFSSKKLRLIPGTEIVILVISGEELPTPNPLKFGRLIVEVIHVEDFTKAIIGRAIYACIVINCEPSSELLRMIHTRILSRFSLLEQGRKTLPEQAGIFKIDEEPAN